MDSECSRSVFRKLQGACVGDPARRTLGSHSISREPRTNHGVRSAIPIYCFPIPRTLPFIVKPSIMTFESNARPPMCLGRSHILLYQDGAGTAYTVQQEQQL